MGGGCAGWCGWPTALIPRGFASAANRAYLTRGGGHYIHTEKLRQTNTEAAAAHRGAAESMNLHAPQEPQTLPLVASSPAQRAETCRLRHGIVSVLPAER